MRTSLSWRPLGALLALFGATGTLWLAPQQGSAPQAAWSGGVSAVFSPPRGGGFSRTERGFSSDNSSLLGQRPQDTVLVSAPAVAVGPLEFSRTGSKQKLQIHLSGVRDTAAVEEGKAVVYRDAWPAVDAYVLRDPQWMELLFVVKAFSTSSSLRFRVDFLENRATLRKEATSGAVIVSGPEGRTFAKIDPPVAIDAAKQTRRGTYVLHGDELEIDLPLQGLLPPIVIDPTFSIPFWSIVEPAPAPGSVVYDPRRLSRETVSALDMGRNKLVSVRPTRSQQPEDAFVMFGKMERGFPDWVDQHIDEQARISNAFLPSAETTAAWKRGRGAESETWEWDEQGWHLNDSARLPGLIGASMAFDPSRKKMVLFGGGAGISCRLNFFDDSSAPFYCSNVQEAGATYEYDGLHWTTKEWATSPTPRLRPAMGWSGSLGKVLLFGGRGLATTFGEEVPTNPFGIPYPENLATPLLNDLWAYDGASWSRIPTGNPPPAREGAQLIFDEARQRILLTGGRTAEQTVQTADTLSLWEFDGIDWSDRLGPIAASLPAELRTRKGATFFWNPARQRVMLFGGLADRLQQCTLSDPAIAQQLVATENDPPGRLQLAATGCLGGYLHDFWEWTGEGFERVGAVAFGGVVDGIPVFSQAQGGTAWSAAPLPTPPVAPAVGTVKTPLWPWRFDAKKEHFALRTNLERAYLAPVSTTTNPAPPPTSTVSGESPASPLFVSHLRPDVAVRQDGTASLLLSEQGRIFGTNGAQWTEVTPSGSPFGQGKLDFFAAAWDESRKQIVLFEPTTGATWIRALSGGWSKAAVGVVPAAWPLNKNWRSLGDIQIHRSEGDSSLDNAVAEQEAEQRLIQVGVATPQAAFDLARGRTVMLYGGQVWEWDGQAWSQHQGPPGWSTCEASVGVVYDEGRAKTVAFGCKIPSQTVEWDGVAWTSPAPGPHVALVARDNGDIVPNSYTEYSNWKGTLQLPVAHPNHATYSSLFGGVITLDADGTLRKWTGAVWTSGPTLPSAFHCRRSEPNGNIRARGDFPFPLKLGSFLGRANLPLCFFPPLVEDKAQNRVLAFRDGPKGTVEAVRGVADTWSWRDVLVGMDFPSPLSGSLLVESSDFSALTRPYPYPFELSAPEQVHAHTHTDPQSRVSSPDLPPVQLPGDAWRVEERLVDNAWWSFRLFREVESGNVRMLSHRGMLWEFGSEPIRGLGESCESSSDCGQGSCTSEKLCCDNPDCGAIACSTCKGAVPGICSPVEQGEPEPSGRCGYGPCAGFCNGGLGVGACAFDPYRKCGGTVSCANGFLNPGGHCAPDRALCVEAGQDPACPVSLGGSQDATALIGGQPCSLQAQPCSGGLRCGDGSCKITCINSKADCISSFHVCGAQGDCVPDSIAQLADSMGITPTVWNRTRTPDQEIAERLLDAGAPPAEDGGVLLPIPRVGVEFIFDPNRKNPLTGIRSAMRRMRACWLTTQQWDGCVAGMPRCEGATPWLGDPSGEDCLPEACILLYLQSRTFNSVTDAANNLLDSACYPGLVEFLNEGVQP